MSPLPTPVTGPPVDAAAPAESGHQCGRCRQWFPIEDGPAGAAPGDWWTCAPCHESLFSSRTVRTS